MLKTLPYPIEVFREPETRSLMAKSYLKLFDSAPWDEYLLRQRHIETICENFSHNFLTTEEKSNYYSGHTSLRAIFSKLDKSKKSEKIRKYILNMKATRKRFISEVIVLLDDAKIVSLNRVKSIMFSQENAQLNNDNEQDYRKKKRTFYELPDEYFTKDLIKLIESNVYRVLSSDKNIKKLRVTIHHTQIVATRDVEASNSPEGIHQDGMDYIVSAYVLERKNITGGYSLIYGPDKKTPILKTLLKAGDGIFQPDLNTDLWHSVESIRVKNEKSNGYRSSIGLDFSIEERHP